MFFLNWAETPPPPSTPVASHSDHEKWGQLKLIYSSREKRFWTVTRNMGVCLLTIFLEVGLCFPYREICFMTVLF